ncbi:MAG: hypothetical protein HC905_24885 [Bacteroidales bacterium]|nr:hypothetical protein [Bacteroidales bacterium]
MNQPEIEEELKALLSLIKREKEEELAQYNIKMAGTSFAERRKQGLCWYPVRIEKTSFDAGERLMVRISRSREHLDSHLFQSGNHSGFFRMAQVTPKTIR